MCVEGRGNDGEQGCNVEARSKNTEESTESKVKLPCEEGSEASGNEGRTKGGVG